MEENLRKMFIDVLAGKRMSLHKDETREIALKNISEWSKNNAESFNILYSHWRDKEYYKN